MYLICGTGPEAAQQARDEVVFWELDPADDRAVYGSAEDIAAGANRWIDAGADTIVFQSPADVDIEEFVGVIGQVQALIAAR